MTRREFFSWLKLQGCEIVIKEGINNTAPPIVIENRKNNRFSYVALPVYDDIVPRKSIEKTISDLGIEPPKGF